MRGEHIGGFLEPLKGAGSSPRARGAPAPPTCPPRAAGIIPACAGSTNQCNPCEGSAWDHPRVRGEHSSATPSVSPPWGSSPRARGAHHLLTGLRRVPGIIPACAGSTITCSPLGCAAWDHPRVRGEHGRGRVLHVRAPGSSPRARGALDLQAGELRPVGIIPACAGSTAAWPARAFSRRDHPRVRGEHRIASLSSRGRAGSSPRARGAQTQGAEGGPTPGIIPACAGSTAVWPLSGRFRRDHPRVRGEHSRSSTSRCSIAGSSPRARGAQVRIRGDGVAAGIIPACAGSTPSPRRAAPTARDHPRVRGEHLMPRIRTIKPEGSSPRARGAHALVDALMDAHGIIPACAGSTRARSWTV